MVSSKNVNDLRSIDSSSLRERKKTRRLPTDNSYNTCLYIRLTVIE